MVGLVLYFVELNMCVKQKKGLVDLGEHWSVSGLEDSSGYKKLTIAP